MNRRFTDKLRGGAVMAVLFIAASRILVPNVTWLTDLVFAAAGALVFLAVKDE